MAWQRLCQLYGPVVYHWARHAGLQDSDASDVMQEVFRRVATGIGSFHKSRPGDSFRGWLWTITRNEIRRFNERLKSLPQPTGGSDAYDRLTNVPDLLESDSEPSGFDAQSAVVHRALGLIRPQFEEHTWQAFWRSAVEGQSASEIAAELDMSAGAVRQASTACCAASANCCGMRSKDQTKFCESHQRTELPDRPCT